MLYKLLAIFLMFSIGYLTMFRELEEEPIFRASRYVPPEFDPARLFECQMLRRRKACLSLVLDFLSVLEESSPESLTEGEDVSRGVLLDVPVSEEMFILTRIKEMTELLGFSPRSSFNITDSSGVCDDLSQELEDMSSIDKLLWAARLNRFWPCFAIVRKNMSIARSTRFWKHYLLSSGGHFEMSMHKFLDELKLVRVRQMVVGVCQYINSVDKLFRGPNGFVRHKNLKSLCSEPLSDLDDLYDDFPELESLNIFSPEFSVKLSSSMFKLAKYSAECAICLEELTRENVVTPSACSHPFHPLCVGQLREHVCPLCREPFNSL